MSRLKAKDPEVLQKRLKLFLFGEAGVGKTTAAISFPQAYVFDCEHGAENEGYVKLMKENKSSILQTNDVEEITQELRTLISEEHSYKTIVLDPMTALETDLIDKAQKKYSGDNDMRVWRDRDQSLRRISNLLLKADMNVVVTAHGKIDYGPGMTRLGTTFDGWKRWPYLFDLVIELRRVGNKRLACVRKTRVNNFIDGEEFEWSYAEFKKRYGEALSKDSTPVQLASPEQIQEITHLIDVLKIPLDTVEKWKSKAQAEEWSEFPAEALGKCIAYCKSIIENKKTI